LIPVVLVTLVVGVAFVVSNSTLVFVIGTAALIVAWSLTARLMRRG
jgi:hypothetical protein